MMSWSYQSSKPCTVLVKEKPDSHHVDCSPSIQSSTNRPNQDSPAEHQQDSVGNIVGGKRKKRQVVDVVVDGDGHESVVESVEKRILVNISIGMDKGLGTNTQEVYHLQVAVPLKHEEKFKKDFYTYQVHESDEEENTNEIFDDFQENLTIFNKTTKSEFDDTTEASGFDFIPLSTSGSKLIEKKLTDINEFAFSSSIHKTNVN